MSGSLIEVGLAFLEGFALIVSPCILPVLPLVLSTSVGGGRARPYGIILGFVASFFLFALFSRWLVSALGLDLDYIKYGSLVLLGAFGLILLSETLSVKFSALTQGAADLGVRLGSSQEGGFTSGIGIGSLIGLVWTPCAGPLLAVVLVQVIRQETNLEGMLVLLSFSVGVGVPMLMISLMGRRLVNHLGFFKRHAEAVRKAFGALILLAVAFIASGVDALTLFQAGGPVPSKEVQMERNDERKPSVLIDGLTSPYPAPQLDGLTNWINTAPLTLEDLKGKVVLVDFWTYSCINCVRTMPYLTSWYDKYRDKGFVIIGVHAPEFEFEKKFGNVQMAVAKYGIHYPVALDNNFTTWRRYNNRFWPAHYLIDKDGRVVYTHFGEGHYDVTENNIRFLLGDVSQAAPMSETVSAPYTPGQTPETYLGAARAERLVNEGGLRVGPAQVFVLPQSSLAVDAWALGGSWSVGAEKIVADEPGAVIRLHFFSGKVYLVLGTSGGEPVTARIYLNGQELGASAGRDAPNGLVTVDRNTLYELINQGEAKEGVVEIKAEAPGLEAYAFTFGK